MHFSNSTDPFPRVDYKGSASSLLLPQKFTTCPSPQESDRERSSSSSFPPRMGDRSASTSTYGEILKMSELPHASNLDPITTKMVRLEDILLSNKPSPPPMHDSSIHGTDAGTFMDNQTGRWTPSENKMFEVALAQVDEHDPQRWEKIAAWVPEKTVAQVKEHYLCLVEDIDSIHAGRVPIPCYVDEDLDHKKVLGEGKKNGKETAEKKKEKETASPEKPSEKTTAKERRRGVPWTEEEHWFVCISILFFNFSSC